MISLVTEGVSLNVCDPECEDVLDREGLSVLLTVIELDKDEMIEILRDSETLRVTGSAGVLVEDGVPGEMDIVKVSECENVPVTEELLLYESLSVIVRVCDSSCVVDDEKECVDVRLDDLDSDGEAERLCDSEKVPVAVFSTTSARPLRSASPETPTTFTQSAGQRCMNSRPIELTCDTPLRSTFVSSVHSTRKNLPTVVTCERPLRLAVVSDLQ